jgi:carotenoid cleavage dioxygenase
MRYPELWRRDAHGRTREQRAVLWKWTIDTVAGTVREEQIDDRAGEFPRVDDRLTGLAAGHGT